MPVIPDLHELRNNSTIGSGTELDEEHSDLCLTYAQTCAEVVRKAWGLGEKPISNKYTTKKKGWFSFLK